VERETPHTRRARDVRIGNQGIHGSMVTTSVDMGGDAAYGAKGVAGGGNMGDA